MHNAYYSLPVNAELVDIVINDEEDWLEFQRFAHDFLVVEYELKSTGALPSAVKGRGHVCRYEDMV